MKIHLRYFASLREALGLAHESIDTHAQTASDLRRQLQARGDPYQQALADERALRCAIDQQLCDWNTPLIEGAEVAIFPPVTGG